MQGLGFNPWPGKDPTCHRATGPMHHNYWTCTLEPMNYNYGSPLAYSLCSTTREATQWEACTRQLEQARVQQQRPTVAKRYRNQSFKKKNIGDFPGSPVVKTSPSNERVAGLIPTQGTKIPHASGPKNQNIKHKQHCNKFNKDLKKKKISFKLEWDHPTPPWGPWTESYGPTDVWNPSVETIHLHSNPPKFKINLIIPFSLLYLMI